MYMFFFKRWLESSLLVSLLITPPMHKANKKVLPATVKADGCEGLKATLILAGIL